MENFIVLAFTLSVLVMTSRAQNDFHDYTVDRLGGTVELRCNDTVPPHVYPNNSYTKSWMLPNLTILYEQNNAKYQVSNLSLVVKDVYQPDFGLYHCMLWTPDNKYFLVRLGLNAEGPYHENLWLKYDMNTYIALGAAGGFLVLTLALIIIYRFRYIPPKGSDDDSSSKSGSDNKGFEVQKEPSLRRDSDDGRRNVANKKSVDDDEKSDGAGVSHHDNPTFSTDYEVPVVTGTIRQYENHIDHSDNEIPKDHSHHMDDSDCEDRKDHDDQKDTARNKDGDGSDSDSSETSL